MTFDTNIPLLTDRPSTSVGQFHQNWNKLNTDFAIDHVGFSAVADNGFHKKAVFVDVTADPGIGTYLYPRSLLYTKHSGLAPNTTNLFFAANNSTDAAVTISQLTNLPITTVALGGPTFAGGSVYGVRTPWGLILNWGTCQYAAGQNNGTVTFAVPFTTIQSITATMNNATASSRGATVSVVTNNNFVLNLTNTASTGYFFAIGV